MSADELESTNSTVSTAQRELKVSYSGKKMNSPYMLKQGKQDQERIYDNGEHMWCPFSKMEMEKMENVEKASQELKKMLYNETLQELSIFTFLKQDWEVTWFQ